MLIGRSDVEGLLWRHPSNVCLQKSHDQSSPENNVSDAETVKVEIEMSDLLLGLRPIKQVYTKMQKIFFCSSSHNPIFSYMLFTELSVLFIGHLAGKLNS